LPLVAFLQHHSRIAPGRGWMRYVYYLAPAVAAFATMATFARAGVIAGIVWVVIAWWHSRRKLALTFALLAGIVAIQPLIGDKWAARMSTTADAQREDSALGRLVAWEWTWDFANRNLLGGGFDVYRSSSAVVQRPDGSEFSINGLASHSIYFEVLGEQGWIGLGIFLSIFAAFFLSMRRVRNRARRRGDLAWMEGLASALMQSMLIFMAGAAFSGIAHQPLHYYLIVFAVSLSAVMVRAGKVAAPPVPRPQVAASGAHLPAWRIRAGRMS
jgi:putative inorganic carbon (hco3(-)) transporter